MLLSGLRLIIRLETKVSKTIAWRKEPIANTRLGDNSSFSFMQNIVDWTDGELLGGPTVNGFIKMTFDNNVRIWLTC